MFYSNVILLIIVFIKSIFSAADTALTYINKAKISQLSKTNKKAKKIKILIENNHKFYGIIEVVITMCELFVSTIAAEEYVNRLAFELNNISIASNIATGISIIIVTILLSYILLVFGAILPKKIARNNPEKTAFKIINVIWIVSKLNYPFEKLITFSINLFSKIFGIKENEKDKLTEKEIKMIILEGKEQGIVAKSEKDILFNALKFDDILVKKIMIPKEKIVFINIDDTKEKILENIKKYKLTRLPVFEKSKDNIVGILNVKDIAIQYAEQNKIELNLKKVIRNVMFVDQDEKISTIFKEMQVNRQAIAIVKNKEEKVVGLITMEDILEKIVGKIFDEFDVGK